MCLNLETAVPDVLCIMGLPPPLSRGRPPGPSFVESLNLAIPSQESRSPADPFWPWDSVSGRSPRASTTPLIRPIHHAKGAKASDWIPSRTERRTHKTNINGRCCPPPGKTGRRSTPTNRSGQTEPLCHGEHSHHGRPNGARQQGPRGRSATEEAPVSTCQ